VRESHKQWCPWPKDPSPETFRFVPTDPTFLVDSYEARSDSFKRSGNTIPSISNISENFKGAVQVMNFFLRIDSF
jgi:hypothetical protein